MKPDIKKYVNKENGKKVLKYAEIVGLVYIGTALAIKSTKFNIHLIVDGEDIGRNR